MQDGGVWSQTELGRQRHDAVPAVRFQTMCEHVDDEYPTIFVGDYCRSTSAAIISGAEGEPVMGEDPEHATFFIPVAYQVLGTPLMAGEDKDVLVAKRPKVGAGAIFTGSCEDVTLHEKTAVGPIA